MTVSTRRPRVLHAQGREGPAPVRLVPRRPRPLAVPAADRAPGRRPRADRPVRAAGRAPAVRRRAPAVGVRQPRACGSRSSRPASRRRACSTPPASARCRPARVTVAVVTSPTGAVWRDVCNVLARRWPLVRVVLVACKVQGDERAGEHRRGAPAARALDRGGAGGGSRRRRPGGDDPGPGRRVAGGPVVVQRRAGRAGRRRAPDAGRVGRGPRGGRDAGRLRRGRPGADALGRRRARRPGPARGASARSAGPGGAPRPPRCAPSAPRAATWRHERRAMARLEPRAQLATSRERVGLLLDRAARVVDERLAVAARRRSGWPSGSRRCCRRASPRSTAGWRGWRSARRARWRPGSGRRRSSLAAGSASLAALAPQATLERGYAIVRRRRRRRDPARPRGRARRHAASRSRSPAASSPRPATEPAGTIGATRRAATRSEEHAAVTEATGPAPNADVEALAYDEAFAEYQRTVATLEAGGLPARGDHRPVRAGDRPPAPLRAPARRGGAPRPAADGRRRTAAPVPVDVRPEDAEEE